MKKIFILTLISGILLLSLNTSMPAKGNINPPDMKAQLAPNNSQIDGEESKEQIYYNLFVTLLYPYVEEAIDNYYSEYMTYLPGEAPYSYRFISIKKTPGLNYSYTVELEVQPYVGPHLSVGRDRIIFSIDLGEVKMEKYEHLESYELPPHYQDILKKKLPH